MTLVPLPLLFVLKRPKVRCSKVPRAAGEAEETPSEVVPACIQTEQMVLQEVGKKMRKEGGGEMYHLDCPLVLCRHSRRRSFLPWRTVGTTSAGLGGTTTSR